MVIFKKSIPRRSFLQGAGAAIALPLLDAMSPALSAAVKSPTRLGFVYVPNGAIMNEWTPSGEGTRFALPAILEPLAAYRDKFSVLSGLSLAGASRRRPGEGGGDHSIAGSTFLTGVHPNPTEGADIRAAVTVDQIVAKEFAKHTQVASLELSLNPSDFLGGCEKGWSCAYIDTLSWRGPQSPNPMEDNPRHVFERLFGQSASPEQRLDRIRNDRSILDYLVERTARLKQSLGVGDSRKLTEYLDAIRDVERRIQMAEAQPVPEVPKVEWSAGTPNDFQDYARLMFDLQVLAYRADITRVITFMFGREASSRSYPEIGISDPHHPMSHHAGDPEKMAKCLQINIYHSKIFAYYLEKLRSTPDGDGTLLDHMMLLYGGGLSDGNIHDHGNLPILLFPGQDSRIQVGHHIRFPKEKDTPLANLHLTVMDRLGIPMEKFGDSTGALDLLNV